MADIRGGLKELPKDSRDYKLGQVFKLTLDGVPEAFEFGTLEVKDQQDTDFCAAFATATIKELQEGVTLSPEYLFAQAKRVEGDVSSWGLSLRDVCKALQKYGIINKKDAPFSVKDKDRDFLANYNNWGTDLEQQAYEHRAKSYFKVEGSGLDATSAIKAAIYKFRDQKRAVIIGVQWGWPLSQKIIKDIPSGGFGHAVAVIGWKKINGEDYLMIQNSTGRTAGEDGKHFIHRDVINHFVGKYGAFFFSDIDVEDAKEMIDRASVPYWLLALRNLIYGTVCKTA